MSEQRLYSLLKSLFRSAEDLEQHLTLAGLKQIATSTFSPRDPLDRAALEVCEALSRHSIIEPFLTYCTGQFPRRTPDIELVALELGLRLGARARQDYLQALIASVEGRQTLAGLRRFAVDLAGVFIEREFTFVDEPVYARSTLLSWIHAQQDGEALILLGEPGAGKTELLFHTAARLAELALQQPSAPIPLIITARDLVAGKRLEDALRRQGHASEDFLAQLGCLTTMRWVLLIDGLDEAQEHSLLRYLTDERARFASHIVALVLTSRPAFVPMLPRCRRANLCRWSKEEGAEFLTRWASLDAMGAARIQSHLDDPGLAEMFTNPLTATLSVFTVSQWPEALPSRACLYASVYGRVLQKWPEQRTPDAPQSPWKSVAGILRELAVDCLRQQRTSVPRSMLETLLQAHAPDSWSELLDEIEVHLGILAPYNGNRELIFHDRRLMEYLAAEQMLLLPEQFLPCACEPWAHEPVRLAFGLLASRQPDAARVLLNRLILSESADTPGLHNRALRPVLIAIDVASDEPALDAAVAPQLADALFRWITEEYSNWVGDTVARHAQQLARRNSHTFAHLKPRLLELLTDESLRKPFFPSLVREMFPSRDQAFMGLLHRDVLVRQAACEHLERYVDDPDVQIRLEHMLFDRGSFRNTELPLIAGFALRKAARNDHFALTLSSLRRVLGFKAQMPSCGAAIALHPHEAPAEELAQALAAGLNGSTSIPSEVFEALERDSSGQDAIRAHLANWRERLKQHGFPALQPEPLIKFPYTGTVRARAFEVLTGFTEIPDTLLDEILAVPGNMHGYTESLDGLGERALYRLLGRVRETNYPLCSVAQEKLGQRAMRDSHLSRYVLDWWDSIADGSVHHLYQFPGRALEPLVLAGDLRAIDAYIRWLPHGRQSLGGEPAHFETLIPKKIFARPEIKEAAYRFIDVEHKPDRLLHFPRLARAWECDQHQWNRIEQLLAQEHQNWIDAKTDAERYVHWQRRDYFADLRGVEPPVSTRAVFSRVFEEVARSPRHGEPGHDHHAWHHFMARAIAFATANRLSQDIEPGLRFLAGVDAAPACRRVGLHAACCVLDRLTDDEARRLSHAWSEGFSETQEFELIDHQALAALIARSADSWARVMEDRLSQHRATFYHPLTLLTVFACLPNTQQRGVAKSFLRMAQISPIPWVSRHWKDHRLVRLSGADAILIRSH